MLDTQMTRRSFAATMGAGGLAALTGCSGSNGVGDATTGNGDDVTGIIGAMESEVSSIKDAMDDIRYTTIAGMEFAEGTIGGNKVVVVQCGVGKVNAGICAHTIINVFGASRIINTGVAGNLTSELSINDFVVSVDAVQHDFDASPIGFAKGEIPYTGMFAFPADEGLRELAVQAVKRAAPDSKLLEGRVCTGDQFIATKEQKDAITSTFGGLCAEMEGGAIAQVCHLSEVPYVIIRAISDDSDGMSFEEFQAEAAAECANATIAMVESL